MTPLAGFLDRLADIVQQRPADAGDLPAAQPRQTPWKPGETLLAQHVFGALAERLSPETVLVEESPSTRLDLQQHVPASRPLGFLSAAMGGLGFALPAAIGVKMAQPQRPVVAVVGDGSSLYGIQALWSAQRYGLGVLFVVLSNGAYAIMNHLAQVAGVRRHGRTSPMSMSPGWPLPSVAPPNASPPTRSSWPSWTRCLRIWPDCPSRSSSTSSWAPPPEPITAPP
ncbi:thiamine pyrophosphate-dependent enzyme [Prauserella oleivorans]